MNKKYKLAFLFLIPAAVITLAIFLSHDVAVLSPHGIIADKQKHLMITSTLLMLIVVIPVFIFTFTFAWRYRDGGGSTKYNPDWDHHSGLEFIWWAVPTAIIAVLAVVAWKSSNELDPFRTLSSSKPPIAIQVVALQWKWLFIYPQQNVASVNYLQIPVDTPINFDITSDAPMNSFWIPSLGGQVYAMAGMRTQLHLMATDVGEYAGSSANISGRGFAGMKFIAKASRRADFDRWIASVKSSSPSLSLSAYNKLAEPSVNSPATYYSKTQPGLYDGIMMKYMAPSAAGHQYVMNMGSQ
ncbi:MAG: Ubiquinol oxidase subunit 2 [Candidatus Saccharibacteria bacterium]|nr:Ubiquinol oxidase subunit 2 [Candidatus Saccharibacteria bacterium]